MHDRPSAGIEVEVQSRQAVELKSQEAEHLAAELASALNVMTSHCEELERQAQAAAAQESAVSSMCHCRHSLALARAVSVFLLLLVPASTSCPESGHAGSSSPGEGSTGRISCRGRGEASGGG